jgi:hypothetical protein
MLTNLLHQEEQVTPERSTSIAAQPQHAEKQPVAGPVSWTTADRFLHLWYRLRLMTREMNYAARRIAELQAPWMR